MRRVIGLVLVSLCAAGVSLGAEAAPADPAVWRTSRDGGVNCLYLLLRLSGRDADYGAVREALGDKAARPGLTDLRAAAGRLGLRAAVYKAGPDQLAARPGPVIALMETDGEGSGRYVVVAGVGADGFKLIDGPLATVEEVSHDAFRREWSGYVLAPEPPRAAPWAVSLAGGLGLVAGYVWLRRGALRGRARRHSFAVHPADSHTRSHHGDATRQPPDGAGGGDRVHPRGGTGAG